MANYVNKFVISGTEINVQDTVAQSAANAAATKATNAQSAADAAATTANSAMEKITEIENLARINIEYSTDTSTITITTGTHAVE